MPCLSTCGYLCQPLQGEGEIDVTRNLLAPLEDRGQIRGGQLAYNVIIRGRTLFASRIYILLWRRAGANHDTIRLYGNIRREYMTFQWQLSSLVNK